MALSVIVTPLRDALKLTILRVGRSRALSCLTASVTVVSPVGLGTSIVPKNTKSQAKKRKEIQGGGYV